MAARIGIGNELRDNSILVSPAPGQMPTSMCSGRAAWKMTRSITSHGRPHHAAARDHTNFVWVPRAMAVSCKCLAENGYANSQQPNAKVTAAHGASV